MNNSSNRRLFVAVPLPDEWKTALGAWRHAAAGMLPFEKWVLPQDLHITLQFLGDTPEPKWPEIAQRLQDTAARCSPFQLSVAGLGVFGPPAAPSVLWAGLDGELEPLERLQRSVVAGMAAIGFEPEQRRFSPHLTLARRYKGAVRFSRTVLQEMGVPLPDAAWKVRGIVLYESHLKKRPMYEEFRYFPFP